MARTPGSPSISVVIVAWESGPELVECVRSLAGARSVVDPSPELIVVDNAQPGVPGAAEVTAPGRAPRSFETGPTGGSVPRPTRALRRRVATSCSCSTPTPGRSTNPLTPLLAAFAENPESGGRRPAAARRRCLTREWLSRPPAPPPPHPGTGRPGDAPHQPGVPAKSLPGPRPVPGPRSGAAVRGGAARRGARWPCAATPSFASGASTSGSCRRGSRTWTCARACARSGRSSTGRKADSCTRAVEPPARSGTTRSSRSTIATRLRYWRKHHGVRGRSRLPRPRLPSAWCSGSWYFLSPRPPAPKRTAARAYARVLSGAWGSAGGYRRALR